MIAPLFKKNTLEQTQFAVTATGFLYKGRTYDFSEVVETRSYRAIHQTRHIPLGVTTSHNPAMSFLLVLKDGEHVQVTEQSTLMSSSKQVHIDQLQRAFEELCTKTFQQRAQKYVVQIQSTGLFEYSGWRFSPGQQKLIDADSGRAYTINELQFLRSYGFIEVVPTQESFTAKVLRKSKQELSGRMHGIGTLCDTDVFFALLISKY